MTSNYQSTNRKNYDAFFQASSLATKEAQKRTGTLASSNEHPYPTLENILYSLDLMKKDSSKQPKGYPTFRILSELHPPSRTSFRELENIPVLSLRYETRHEGRQVLVRIVKSMLIARDIVAVVEDGNGTYTMVHYLVAGISPESALGRFSTGRILIVKEPFYTRVNLVAGCLQVSHVSDLLFVNESLDITLPKSWAEKPVVSEGSWMESMARMILGQAAVTNIGEPEEKFWEDIMREGDAFFKKKLYTEAIDRYNYAISQRDLPPLESGDIQVEKLYLNRSKAFLEEGLFKKAIQDATLLHSHAPMNLEFMRNLANCQYRSGDYDACRDLLVGFLKQYSTDKVLQDISKRVIQRQAERDSGSFDFEDMARVAERTGGGSLDCADYIGPVIMKTTDEKGRGLYATKAMQAGQLVLCCKACSMVCRKAAGVFLEINVSKDEVNDGTAVCVRSMIANDLYNEGQKSSKFLELSTSQDYPRPSESMVDGKPVVDSFLIQAIIDNNAFSSLPHPHYKANTHSEDPRIFEESMSGAWIFPSMINHSCMANSQRSHLGDMMIVRTVADVKPGEEITITYIDITGEEAYDIGSRTTMFINNWGFTCKCSLCVNQRLETTKFKTAISTRKSLLTDKIAPLLETSSSSTSVGMKEILQLEGLVDDLQKTYRLPATDLPRFEMIPALRHLQTWYMERGLSDKAVLGIKKILDCLGWVVSTSAKNRAQRRKPKGQQQQQQEEKKPVVSHYGFLMDPELITLFTQAGMFEFAMNQNPTMGKFWLERARIELAAITGLPDMYFNVYENELRAQKNACESAGLQGPPMRW